MDSLTSASSATGCLRNSAFDTRASDSRSDTSSDRLDDCCCTARNRRRARPVSPASKADKATPLADIPRQPGLYAASGFGARGLVWASLVGELLASQIHGDPLPLERDLVDAMDPARYLLKNVLLLLAVAGVGLALARPQWGEQTEISHLYGQDTLFILDCSRSMLASDLAPSRLQRTKLALRDYVQHRGRGRVGLVACAGQAFLQCPLTYDYAAFQDALAAVDDQAIPVPGTDLGRALDEASRALAKSRPPRLCVLLTDGEDLERGGIRAAQTLAKQGLIVFTIGVGTAAGAEIQFTNEHGQRETLRDRHGEVVRSRLDEATLRAIAQATGGAYFPLGPLGEGLARVQLALADLQAGPASAPARKLGVDRFHWPVAGVLALLILESLIGTRRRLRDINA